MVESVNENTPVEDQQKDVEIEDTKARLEGEVKQNKTRIPTLEQCFICWQERKLYAVRSESSPAAANKEEIGFVATDGNK